jgi:hypothetical protein
LAENNMRHSTLEKKYPPSPPCSCKVCRDYCRRPGWWSVEQAKRAIDGGFADRMMLEISPELSFGVLSPAFKGNEVNVALQVFAQQGCTFLNEGLCVLFGTDLQPLECRFCHHSRQGLGPQCHADLEKDWNSREGQKLVIRWSKMAHLFEHNGLLVIPADTVADIASGKGRSIDP